MTEGSSLKADGQGLVGNEEAFSSAPGTRTSAAQTDLAVGWGEPTYVWEPTF